MVIAPTIGWKVLVTETSSDTIGTAMGAVTFQMTRWQRPSELQQRLLLPVKLGPLASPASCLPVTITALFYR